MVKNETEQGVMQATPVRQDKFPSWFRKRLLRLYGHDKSTIQDYVLFKTMARKHCASPIWCDHTGVTTINGQTIPVSEPYLRVDDDLTDAHQFAELVGCNLVISENSHWYPGKTIRLAFVPKTE
jgi:hypothetical protein